MGGNVSKKSVDKQAINKLITDVIIKNVSKTSQDVDQSQTISIIGSSNTTMSGISLSQIARLDVSSISNNKTQAQIMTEIMNELSARLSSSFKSSVGNIEASKIKQKVKNIIKNEFSYENVKNCIIGINQHQEILVQNSRNVTLKDVSLEQSLKMLTQCLAKSDNIQQITNDINNEVKDKVETSFSFFSMDIFIYIAIIIFVMIIVIIIIIVVIAKV